MWKQQRMSEWVNSEHEDRGQQTEDRRQRKGMNKGSDEDGDVEWMEMERKKPIK